MSIEKAGCGTSLPLFKRTSVKAEAPVFVLLLCINIYIYKYIGLWLGTL